MDTQTRPGSVTDVSQGVPYTAYDILKLNHRQLCDVFATLDAPALGELDGEYRLSELSQQSQLQRLFVLSFQVKSMQLCKAFQATSSDVGRGYNGVVTPRGVERRMLFETRIKPSRVDGRDALHIMYEPYNPEDRVLRSIVDELRKVRDGVYLGLGYAGDNGHRRVLWPFMLEGPGAPFETSVFPS